MLDARQQAHILFEFMIIQAGRRHDKTTLDEVHVEKCGILAVRGWDARALENPDVRLQVNERAVEPTEFYRCYRPDVAQSLRTTDYFLGFVAEFLLPGSLHGERLTITVDGQAAWSEEVHAEVRTPDYSQLLDEGTVRHREQIYGYGPPATFVPEEVLRIVEGHLGNARRVLDFGCGRGNLVAHLRQCGWDAHGIEIDRPAVRDAILAECRAQITLYDGKFPLPYRDGEFDAVVAVEVLEHVPEYDAALSEINRVARQRLILTVPDMSSIPRCFPQAVVPWHLLEATHVNFFTAKSLRAWLLRYWQTVRLLKCSFVTINDSHFAGSLVAVCERQAG
jgi:2-polyprenyl-3-methyl-5-hydroxy-6-metoxy-1,4-benzoquinol methylase